MTPFDTNISKTSKLSKDLLYIYYMLSVVGLIVHTIKLKAFKYNSKLYNYNSKV